MRSPRAAGQLLAAALETAARGHHDDGPQGRRGGSKPDPEDQQNQKRTEDESEKQARLAQDLEEVLAEKRQRSDQAPALPAHLAASFARLRSVSAAFRPIRAPSSSVSLVTSSTKTSSKAGRYGSTDSISTPASVAQAVTCGETSPASATTRRTSWEPIRSVRTAETTSASWSSWGASSGRAEDDIEDFAAESLAPEAVGGVNCDQTPFGQDPDPVAIGGFADVLGGDEQGAALIAELAEVVPNLLPENRIDACGRLIEEQQVGIVDQRCRQGEATLHSARRVPQKAGPGIVQFDQLQLFASSGRRRPRQGTPKREALNPRFSQMLRCG